MTFIDGVVLVQMGTLAILAVSFWQAGLRPLAVAQCCYLVATAALFFGKA